MLSCCVRVDRVQIASWAAPGQKPPVIPGFRILRDHFVRPQTSVQTYARCRRYHSTTNGAQIFWQYQRRKGWLRPWKITLVADDQCGLSRGEVSKVLRHCHLYQFLIAELAVDFIQSSGITEAFVSRHGVFGKSRRCEPSNDAGVKKLRYGSRKSEKFVRCYRKKELGVYRVELEVHSSFLSKHNIEELDDLADVGRAIFPKHIRFVNVDWDRLERYLVTKAGKEGKRLFGEARKRSDSIAEVASYLRNSGVVNVHRFLVPMAINTEIKQALDRWANQFRRKIG